MIKLNKVHVLIRTFCLVLLLTSYIFSQTVKLKIIETTDEHGQAFPYSFTDYRDMNSSLAQVTTFVKGEREKKDQETILLSGGDLLQGTPLVYYYNFEKTDALHAFAEMMNYMCYDAGTVGNHDIETGHAVYDRFNKEVTFPWLAANAIDVLTKGPYFKPYTVIERKGIKIAVLGLITPAIPNWLPKNIWSGMEFTDMIESAKHWVEIIKEKEKPDLLIGLFHSGVEYTYNNQTIETYKNENASQLVAQQVPGFDVVFVGHDHHGWNFSVNDNLGNKVLILGGVNSARDAAVANIILDYEKQTGTWKKNISGEIIEMKNFKPDSSFMEKFNNAFEETKKYVQHPLGILTESISTRDAMFGNSTFVDLIQTIQLDITKADISFTSPLAFDVTIPKGEITVGKMFDLYRYENLLYTMELSGQEIKNYLEFSYSLWFNQMKDENDHLIRFDYDEKGEIKLNPRNQKPLLKGVYYNFDSATGIDYTVDVSKKAGERINIKSISNGSEFNLGKKYKVALNSYRGNGGGNLLTQGAGIPKADLEKRIINSTDKDLRYYLMKWIENKKTVEPPLLKNWKVIPEQWWQNGKSKDFLFLFK
jgi:2',3'-cyclic-nucleotide 2'-phosphodiesterase / 3'-nucleotidase